MMLELLLSRCMEATGALTRARSPEVPEVISGRAVVQSLSYWASLVAQWFRVRLPMQGTRVRALVWEDPTCRGATKPVRHNY